MTMVTAQPERKQPHELTDVELQDIEESEQELRSGSLKKYKDAKDLISHLDSL